MARKVDPAVAGHLEWLGFVQPTGLVVSAPALAHAGVVLDRSDGDSQERLLEWQGSVGDDAERRADFREFASAVLGWEFNPRRYAGRGADPIPEDLSVELRESGETVRPDYAVRGVPRPAETHSVSWDQAAESRVEYGSWQLLVRTAPAGAGFDDRSEPRGGVSPHQQMERLLRAREIPAGLLFNGDALRLISAPRGESSGWLDFVVAEMAQPAGRPIASALRLLLGQRRLHTGHSEKRLSGLLSKSREYQNEVSERLSEQVLHALYELLRGLQAAHDASRGELLRETLAEDRNAVYHALLTVVLRLVFLLYAEQRDLMPRENGTFRQFYSLLGLHDRLRDDRAQHPDTMDQRYGAWPQLLALFRLVHDGMADGPIRLPRRPGGLFDPDRFPFLEGRRRGSRRTSETAITAPLISDGVIHRVLSKLLVLDGERISYRALDVEHIGSVYETMMGFSLELASGRSLAIRAAKKGGAPNVVDLEALLRKPAGSARGDLFSELTGRKPNTVSKAVNDAEDLESLHAALGDLVDTQATPDLVPEGALILQPTDERRRSGSHYTPRALTEPIVRRTLEPVLAPKTGSESARLTPEQILDLKVCDLAMGSGAFLVAVCRYLGERLVEAWRAAGGPPEDLPPGDDERIHAMRLVAQRCLYGVDKNPMATDLAKLSLWLVTLSRDHPLTFLEHALRDGDSLVGLSLRQIETFDWRTGRETVPLTLGKGQLDDALREVLESRRRIREAGEYTGQESRREWWAEAVHASRKGRFEGDLLISAFFEESKPTARIRRKDKYDAIRDEREEGATGSKSGRRVNLSFAPFHWDLEFPEVFSRDNPGFDAIVGNPPYLGGKRISTTLGTQYRDWLADMHQDGSRGADLAAHFFRRAFLLLREGGALGLVATNSIAEGDTRFTGLRWICENGGEIYWAQKCEPWPGAAAVIVSIVHIFRGRFHAERFLNDAPVGRITAFLFHAGPHSDPSRLLENKSRSFVGSFLRGKGFIFEDGDPEANPTTIKQSLLSADPRNDAVIFPYITGKELTTDPRHAPRRSAISFHDWPLGRRDIGESWHDADAERRKKLRRQRVVPMDYDGPVAEDYPLVLRLLEEKVKPYRETLADSPTNAAHRERWWCFGRHRPALHGAAADLERLLALSAVAQYHAVAFLPTKMIYSHSTILFPFDTYAAFCALQSRVHEVWVSFCGSSLGVGPRYTPSDCFDTFPWPDSWISLSNIEEPGREYYDHRARLMLDRNEGLTRIYNRFHDPLEADSDIVRLRELHDAMDCAVLAAYGWSDISPDCDFYGDDCHTDADFDADRRRRKRFRYRWPDTTHDEVLVRLLDLNARRAAA